MAYTQRHGWVAHWSGIGLGTVLLLGNLHYLQWDSLDLLLRLWPVLRWLGLDIAFGKDNFGVEYLWTVLGLACAGGGHHLAVRWPHLLAGCEISGFRSGAGWRPANRP